MNGVKRFAIALVMVATAFAVLGTHASAATSPSILLQLGSSSSQFQYSIQSAGPFIAVITGSSSGPAPSGTVTYYDQNGPIGSTTTFSSVGLPYIVKATFATNALSVGSHTIHSVYSGDSYYAGTTSGSLTVTISPATTTTSLSINGTPDASGNYSPGERLTLNAQVSSTTISGSFTGTVRFTDGGATLGTATINGSSVSIAATFTSQGTHDLAASYSGSSNITGSTSATDAISVKNDTVVAPPPTSAPPAGTTQTAGAPAPPLAASSAPSASATASADPSTTPAPANRPLGAPQGESLPATVFDKAVVPPIQALELGAASGIAFGKAVLLTPFLIPINILGLIWLAYAWRKGRKLSKVALIGRPQSAAYEGKGVSTARQQYQAATER